LNESSSAPETTAACALACPRSTPSSASPPTSTFTATPCRLRSSASAACSAATATRSESCGTRAHVAANVQAKQWRPAPGSASRGSAMHTVIATPLRGVAPSQLDAIVRHTATAAAPGDAVSYAFLGASAPCSLVRDGGVDSHLGTERALQLAEHGIPLSDTRHVPASHMVLLVGYAELAWLRLSGFDRCSREVARAQDGDAMAALLRATPLSEYPGVATLPKWQKHDASLRLLAAFGSASADADADVVTVLALLKLRSVACLTMDAPGLLPCFSNCLQHCMRDEDANRVPFLTLDSFLSETDGDIESGLKRLVVGSELSIEGLGLLPAAVMVVDAVLDYAENVAVRYLLRGKVAHVVHNSAPGGRGALQNTLELSERGLCLLEGDGGTCERPILPCGIDPDTLAATCHARPAEADCLAWSKRCNLELRRFVGQFIQGNVDKQLYHAYLACSLQACKPARPPFATLERTLKVRPQRFDSALLRVLETRCSLSAAQPAPTACWAVATWSVDTQASMHTHSPLLDRSVAMSRLGDDADAVLSSLLQHAGCSAHAVCGTLGPFVASRQLRLATFEHLQTQMLFVALLPEAYVRHAVDYYNYDLSCYAPTDAPLISVQAAVALPDDATVSLLPPEAMRRAQRASTLLELGSRLWAFSATSHDTPSESVAALLETMLLCDTNSVDAKVLPGVTVLHMQQTSLDALVGLPIGLARVPGMPRLTIDTDVTDAHAARRLVAEDASG